MSRAPLIVANWKMYKTSKQAHAFIRSLALEIGSIERRVFIAPSFTAISSAVEAAKGSRICIGAQNMHEQLEEIEEIRSDVLSMMPDNVPEDLDFKFTSHYHMSAFMYGGTVQYKAKVSYDPPKFIKEEYYVFGD